MASRKDPPTRPPAAGNGGREPSKSRMGGARPGFDGPYESVIQAMLHGPTRASVREGGSVGGTWVPPRIRQRVPRPRVTAAGNLRRVGWEAQGPALLGRMSP